MKIQDQYKFDSTPLGLNNLYQTIKENSFFINSECVLSTNKIITTGNIYLIVDKPIITGTNMYTVNLLDVYYQEGVIHMIVRDIISQRMFTIHHCIKCPETHCTWMLIDFDYCIDEMNTKVIKSFCGKCAVTKKKPIAEGIPKFSHYESMDFEY